MLAAGNIHDGVTTRRRAVRGDRIMPKKSLASMTLLAGLAWSFTAHAQSPRTSTPNIFGGYNYSNGGYSTPNIFGGYNFNR
jgi:hypothetical protein